MSPIADRRAARRRTSRPRMDYLCPPRRPPRRISASISEASSLYEACEAIGLAMRATSACSGRRSRNPRKASRIRLLTRFRTTAPPTFLLVTSKTRRAPVGRWTATIDSQRPRRRLPFRKSSSISRRRRSVSRDPKALRPLLLRQTTACDPCGGGRRGCDVLPWWPSGHGIRVFAHACALSAGRSASLVNLTYSMLIGKLR